MPSGRDGAPLIVVALVGNVAAVVDPSEAVYGLGGSPLPATDIAAVVIDGLQGLTPVAVSGSQRCRPSPVRGHRPRIPASEGGQGNRGDLEHSD